MTIGKFALRFAQIAATALLLTLAPADRALATTADDVKSAYANYKVACGMYQIVKRTLVMDEISLHSSFASLNYIQYTQLADNVQYLRNFAVPAWGIVCNEMRSQYAAALTAAAIELALSEPEQVAKPKPKPKPTRTMRRPRPSDEEAAAQAEEPPRGTGVHDPGVSALVGIGVGVAIGSAIRGGRDGGGGGGGRRAPSGGGGCPGGRC